MTPELLRAIRDIIRIYSSDDVEIAAVYDTKPLRELSKAVDVLRAESKKYE